MLQDHFLRKFQYVRLSVTDNCNFKCKYCLPNGYQKTCSDSNLSLSEIDCLVAGLVEMGVWKIRLTGGEPTLRSDLTDIICLIKKYPAIKQIGLTTNGYKLADKVNEYFEAGLTNLNVSIDSLDRNRFQQITGVNKLDYIKKSLEIALAMGVNKIKINVVLLPHTLDELNVFLDYIKEKPISVRFIELMQTGDNRAYFTDNYVNAALLRSELLKRNWSELPREVGDGPAVEFCHPEYTGKVGIIAPYSKGFCDNCNRLRFTYQGSLRLCLFGDDNYPLRNLLQSSAQKPELKQAILNALNYKPKEHLLSSFKTGNIKNLSNVGG